MICFVLRDIDNGGDDLAIHSCDNVILMSSSDKELLIDSGDEESAMDSGGDWSMPLLSNNKFPPLLIIN